MAPSSITFPPIWTLNPISKFVAESTTPCLLASTSTFASTGSCPLVATTLPTVDNPWFKLVRSSVAFIFTF